MKTILHMAAMTLGGWIGWALGARFGIMIALFLSLVGTAAGLFLSRRFTRDFLA